MGASRWCKSCHSNHERPTGSKCHQLLNIHQTHTSEGPSGQASNASDREIIVMQEQARLVADQLLNSEDNVLANSTQETIPRHNKI